MFCKPYFRQVNIIHSYTNIDFRNKLSTSILGPSNKNYITEGSLFNWDRETVLVFGGIDPHTTYGIGKNTGKDIYRFSLSLQKHSYCNAL